MEFLQAREEDVAIICSLYKGAIGSYGCTWDEHYPTAWHTKGDFQRGDLYCLKDETGKIIAAIAIDDDKEVDKLECWSKNGSELSRLVVDEEFQNKGIAGYMITKAMEVLKQRGFDYVHFLVSKEHIKALKAYDKLAFENVGESDLYGGTWWCYEKKL